VAAWASSWRRLLMPSSNGGAGAYMNMAYIISVAIAS
jgi:hypothetical protein